MTVGLWIPIRKSTLAEGANSVGVTKVYAALDVACHASGLLVLINAWNEVSLRWGSDCEHVFMWHAGVCAC